VYDAARAIAPFAGDLAVGLFTVGLFGASLLGLTIVPLATSYVFSEMFGTEGSLDSDFTRGKIFYGFFSIQIIIGLIAALFPATNLFSLTLYADYLNAALLPLIFYFLITFSENKDIMGEYASKGFTSLFIRIGGVFITCAVAITIFGKIFRLY
jgi:Mn2+/Fe2+ NRAMP family transporter